MNKEDILIVCALEEETNGKLDGWNVVYTGVGKVNATYELTAELFFQMKLSKVPKLVINFGTAGSREIPIHTLVDCNQFIQRDMDATGLGFFKGQTPFEDYVNGKIECEQEIRERVKNYIIFRPPYLCGKYDDTDRFDYSKWPDVYRMDTIDVVDYMDVSYFSYKVVNEIENKFIQLK